MKLIIGNKNYSSWSLRPWLLLSFHDIEFEELRVPLAVDGFKYSLLKYSKTGLVPVLQDADLTIWDSLAICEYLSEQYLSGKGWPSDSASRAEARSVCSEMHSGFPQIRNCMPMNVRATGRTIKISPALHKEIERIQDLWCGLRRKNTAQGPWLFGEFCIADCMFAPVVFRFSTYGVAQNDASKSYMDFVLSHPIMKKWFSDSVNEIETIGQAEVGV